MNEKLPVPKEKDEEDYGVTTPKKIDGTKVETMRDLCGSFYHGTTKNQKLMYLIPNATLAAVKNDPVWFGIKPGEERDMYREILELGYNAMMDHPVTRKVLERFQCGEYDGNFIDAVSNEELAELLDVYYVETVSAAVEVAAIGMMG